MAEEASGVRAASDASAIATRPWWKMHLVTALVLLLGLTATSGLAIATDSIHDANEERLIDQRVKEASLILTSAVPSLTSTLRAAAELAEASDVDAREMQLVFGAVVGDAPQQYFDSITIWRRDGSGEPLFRLGAEPQMGSGSDSLRAFLRKSGRSKTPILHVRDLLPTARPSLGYAFSSLRPDRKYIVYAENQLPEDRTQRVQSGSAFENMEYAVYLGDRIDLDRLILASTEDLPLAGNRSAEVATFGDSKLLIAMSSDEDLGGALMARLPWIILFTGIAASIGFGQFAERLIRRREEAQALAAENDRLYRDQRSVAETLQRSLLPSSFPELADIEFRARYEPGVQGIEIGGDWYDVVAIDDDRVLLVVGDVSGRGLTAGSVMASLRYAIRAHATQGDGPAEVLGKLGTILQVVRDRHFATVLCIEVRRSDGSLRIANAGHPRPLYLNGQGAVYLETAVGPPIGVDASRVYEETHAQVSPGGTLLMFSDGLVERRGEPIDESMERLRVIADGISADLDGLLTGVLDAMIEGATTDDTALLGARWRA